jgi:hypothetical protein
MGASGRSNLREKRRKEKINVRKGVKIRRRTVVQHKNYNNTQDGKLSHAVAVKEELQRLVGAVRNKYRQLRRTADEARDSMKIGARPFVEPLQKAVAESLKNFVSPISIKKEEKETIIPKTEQADIDENVNKTKTEIKKTLDTSTQTEKTSSAKKYLDRIGDSTFQDKLDFVYGVRPDGQGGTLIGNSSIKFTRTHVLVNEKSFKISPGLLELLFMKVPNRLLVTPKDLSRYKEILELTNAHLKGYSSEKQINSNRGKKYKSVISALFLSRPPESTEPSIGEDLDVFKGSGIHANTQFTAYNTNVNTLVNRLRLLIMSRSAGHTGHDKEISQILNILRKNRIIL